MNVKRFFRLACVIALVVVCFGCSFEKEEKAEIAVKPASKITPLPEAGFGGEWILRKDIPLYSDAGSSALRAGFYQKGPDARVALQTASGTSTVNAAVSFDPVYFLIIGMPVLVDAAGDKHGDVDYIFRNDRIIFEQVEITQSLQYIELVVCSRKLKNRGKLSMEDKLKQSRTIRRIKAKTASWSPLAKGQIIAQETIKPIVCHGGYDVNGSKIAVIWANNTKLSGTFDVVDAPTNRQHPAKQPVVYSGQIKEAGYHIWGGNNYIADFSDFKKEGSYYVRLRLNETIEAVESLIFPIRNDRYLELAVKASWFFYHQRCGMEVPGFHKACHTHDAIIKTDGTKVDVTGGWHDAGDYGKWIWGGSMGIMALTIFQDEFGSEVKDKLEEMPRLINEIAWEAKYFCKTYWDGEFHPGFTPDFEDVCTWLGAPDKEPPRVVREAECLENNYGITKEAAICFTGAMLARAGRLLMPHDKELAQKCIAVAKDVFDRCVNMDRSLYYTLGAFLFLDMELLELTGDAKYRSDAVSRVKDILVLQAEDNNFYVDMKKEKKSERAGLHLPALYEFIRRNPKSELAPGIMRAFGLWAEGAMKYGHLSPFGQIGSKEKDGTVRNIKPDTNNGRFGENAWAIATAGRLLKKPEYIKAAECQLQWILGFNPADVSMMAGVGKGPGCYHTRYCFMEGCEDGIVPGGITLGIYSGKGEMLELGDLDTKNWVITDAPVDYPIIDTDVFGWTYAYRTSEYALAKGASFIKAAVQIQKAFREMK